MVVGASSFGKSQFNHLLSKKGTHIMKKRMVQVFPLIMMIMICFWIALTWVGVRFVHYHAQRAILAPAHYTAEVIPVGNGTADKELSRFRKSEDGQYYVRVATLGTAHHLTRTTWDLFPPFLLGLLGVVILVWMQRRANAERNQQVQATR